MIHAEQVTVRRTGRDKHAFLICCGGLIANFSLRSLVFAYFDLKLPHALLPTLIPFGRPTQQDASSFEYITEGLSSG